MRKSILIVFLFFGWTISTQAQQQDLDLANQYFYKGEFAKAKPLYELILRKESMLFLVHKNYLRTLLSLQEYSNAEKYLKKNIKNDPSNFIYQVDYLSLLIYLNKTKEAEKISTQLIDLANRDPFKANLIGQFLVENKLLDLAEEIYIQQRKKTNNPTIYSFELINIYLYKRDLPHLLNEFSTNSKNISLDYAKNTIEFILEKEDTGNELEKALIQQSQLHGNQPIYDQLLIWYYIKIGNLPRAFLLAKALDKRLYQKGTELLTLGELANQQDKETEALSIFEYIAHQYPDSNAGIQANVAAAFTEQQLLEKTNSVDQKKINELIKKYNDLLISIQSNQSIQLNIIKNIAYLQAYYLQQYILAIEQVNQGLKFSQISSSSRNELKILLGDIYLLKGETGEAALLYAQVEKEEETTNLGQEAKLKNAKIWYYKGDFQLAQAQLEILKLATSREIANDALELSLFIQEGIGLDSSETALKAFATVELLCFQHQWQQALQQLEKLEHQFPNHSITDNIYWLKAIIYQKTASYSQAVQTLKEMISKFPTANTADDALYLQGKIEEENLKNNSNAMKCYQELYEKHSDSIYAADARKHFRKLRGDQIP